jgi:opacity protein-like surface antigen
MKAFFPVKLLLLGMSFFISCPPLYGSETERPMSYIVAGTGIEQLTYKEQIPDLALTSSDTDLTNWVLYLDGRKHLQDFFIGAKAYIPLQTGEARENWTSRGEFEQTNSLTYRWFRVQTHAGYFLNQFLNPYVGIGWSYAEQERSNFENVSTAGIFSETATEKVYSFSALFGIQGDIPIATRWSFSYCAEYMLPFYSSITNDSLPGWEASDIDGFSYTLTGRLHYAFSQTVSAALQVTGGRQQWEGSDWATVNGSRAKWPENHTDLIGGFLSIYIYF